MEGNPLKQYQFVKVAHQTDLIVFVYSLIYFLQKERISGFKTHKLYPKLQAITSRIYNFLHKISTTHHLKYEQVGTKELGDFFVRFQNSPEIRKNRLIFEILQNIFANQLQDGVFLSKSIDMTKMFETVVAKRLAGKYGNALFRGEESEGKIKGEESYAKQLNEINFLLNDGDKELIRQYPDYLVRENGLYHILDAKYKLYDSLMKSRDAFWQILVYTRLFNKRYTSDLENMKKVHKIILYAEKSNIDLAIFDINNLTIENEQNIDITNPTKAFNENVFNSQIEIIGIRIFESYGKPDIKLSETTLQ